MDKQEAEETLNLLRSGERPKWLAPTRIFDKDHKWHCCHVGCDRLADVVISGDVSYEDYTHMCNDHKDEYMEDYNNVEVEEIIRI
jgi:hypothetical protein